MRNFLATTMVMLSLNSVCAAERWEKLPPTPAPIEGERRAYASVNGIELYYATIGEGPPVVLLHGGLANSDYWGNQVKALASHHEVILVDSRGHGRSTRNQKPFGYDLMTDDVVALLNTLKLDRVDIVGWSDGAIIGLDMAIRYPSRIGKLVAFAGNVTTSGIRDGLDKNPTFNAYIERAGAEYKANSKTPGEYDAFVDQIGKMWTNQPDWSDEQLKSIKASVLIVDGDHDEAIKREHTEHIAATIDGAGLSILPNSSHFAFLQTPDLFNATILAFLDSVNRP